MVVCVVDLRCLLAFQRRLAFNPSASQIVIFNNGDWPALMELCFGPTKPVIYELVHDETSLQLRSSDPNLHLRTIGDLLHPLMREVLFLKWPSIVAASFCGTAIIVLTHRYGRGSRIFRQ